MIQVCGLFFFKSQFYAVLSWTEI